VLILLLLSQMLFCVEQVSLRINVQHLEQLNSELVTF